MLTYIPLILAAGSLPTLISAAPVPSFLSGLVTRLTSSHSLAQRTYTYTEFGGTGEVSDGWPAQSDWLSFDDMWAANQDLLTSSCTQFGVANNSPDELNDMNSAIQSVAGTTAVDARFILAIIMQESQGCVRVWSTVGSVVNPGLMQDHSGQGTCNTGISTAGVVQNPCPASEITQMIEDGTGGPASTATGDGLSQILNSIGGTDVSRFYQAARIYNSGSITKTDNVINLGAGGATNCYASDIANRLLGWVQGDSTCQQGVVGNYLGSDPNGASTTASVTIPTTAQAATPTPTSEAGIFFASATTATTATPAPAASSTTTILVYPTPAATSTTTTPNPAPTTTSTPAAAATTTPSSSTGAEPAGSACTEEGMFNCVGGNSFQQCGSGTWSVIQSLAAGTSCNPGQTQDLIISKPKRARRLEKARIPVWV